MLHLFEKNTYFLLFLLNKYIDTQTTEKWLSSFEKKMINKYLSRKEIPVSDIPTIKAEELTDKKFLEISQHYRKPVLIKGLFKDTNAVKNWNLDYLNQKIGNFKLDTIFYDSEFKIQEMAFNEFVKRHHEGIYINNNHTILSHFPALFDDLKVKFEHLIKTLRSTNLTNIHIANFFIGTTDEKTRATGTNMHAGGSGNFFCQIIGKKTWTMIDPKYTCFLKARMAPNGLHAQTLFDMLDVDITTYPSILNYLPRAEVTLEPGDVLWNAPWHWHRIYNHDGLSIGLAIRNNKVTRLNLQNNLMFTLSGYIYLLYNSYTIALYEKFLGKNKHFGASKEEKKSGDSLYQIEKLARKYPQSVKLEDILE